ncbi:MAG TPA: periplasmic heavy metal sensor [Desulfobacterales bacterium]|nr:periplasmic heavy metal sensor [Desulfobacterales bacterium]HIP40826.1 periplasmic heavy metal sensor [Desulfocapsa sulfexigens]
MKKAIAITAMAAIIGLTGMYQASANRGQGMMGGMMGGGGEGCPGAGMYAATAQMDEATKAKFETFFNDTQALRKKMVVKRAEKRAYMRSTNPDPAAIGKLAGELFDLRASMRAKAKAAGLGDFIGRGHGMQNCDGHGAHHGGRGMMKGHGMMMKGKGMMGGPGMMGGQGMMEGNQAPVKK